MSANDAAFLRRVTLDTIGVLPTEGENAAFLADDSPGKRAKAIDRLLTSPDWADHWKSYWQDVLAENPNILKGTLNNTGPFRWWIREAPLDNKPMDRFVTELITMEGSASYGGPAGFAVASQNNLPMAAKAQIVSSAFTTLAMEEQPVAQLVERMFLRLLSPPPTPAESAKFSAILAPDFAKRRTGAPPAPPRAPFSKGVSWANHLNPDASTAVLNVERIVKAGPVPSPQLASDWRDRVEDALRALLLSPEFTYIP